MKDFPSTQTTDNPPAAAIGEVAPDPVDEFPFGTVDDFIPPNPVSVRPAQLESPARTHAARSNTVQVVLITVDGDPVKELLPAQGNRQSVTITVLSTDVARIAVNESDARNNHGFPVISTAPVTIANHTGALWCNTGAMSSGSFVFLLLTLDTSGVL